MNYTIQILNYCCGKGTKEAQLLVAKLRTLGHDASVTIRHKDNNLCTKYNIDPNTLSKKQYIIIDDFNIIYDTSKTYDEIFLSGIVSSIVPHKPTIETK